MPEVRFDTYYRYEELTRLLRAYADEHPQLVRVDSIGKSHEGRDIWLVTVTNSVTGEDTEKPALWVDGNIHATPSGIRRRPFWKRRSRPSPAGWSGTC